MISYLKHCLIYKDKNEIPKTNISLKLKSPMVPLFSIKSFEQRNLYCSCKIGWGN